MTHRFKVGDRVISLETAYRGDPDGDSVDWPRGVVVAVSASGACDVTLGSNYRWFHHASELRPDLNEPRQQAPAAEPSAPSSGLPCPPSRSRTLPEDSQARKNYPLFTGPLMYFPAALAAVAKLCKDGNDKHNPGEPMHHARGKSSDHEDTILRHMLDACEGDGRDKDGTPHVVNAAWRVLALCQGWLERNDGAPKAPGAK